MLVGLCKHAIEEVPTVQTSKAVIRVYDLAGNVIETHDHTNEFREL